MNNAAKEKVIKGLEQILSIVKYIKQDPIANANQEVLDKITKISTKTEMVIRKDMSNVKR